jgi:peroxiredoxin
MRSSVYTCAAICALVAAWTPRAFANGADDTLTVPNFRFTGVDGEVRELHDYDDAKVLVLFFHMNGCPIVRQSYPYFEQIKLEYSGRGVEFLYINSNKWDTPEAVITERADYKFSPPVLVDSHRVLAHVLGVERSADTFVVDPARDWRVVYRGMADDRFDYGLQRMSPKKFWLRDAIDATLAGRDPARAETVAKGCLLDMDTYQGVTFEEHVRPILYGKLASLFQGTPSEPAAREASDDVLAALLTGQDGSGHEISLTDDQAEILVAWLFDGPR